MSPCYHGSAGEGKERGGPDQQARQQEGPGGAAAARDVHLHLLGRRGAVHGALDAQPVRGGGHGAEVGVGHLLAVQQLEGHVAFDSVPERFAIDQEAEVRIDVGEDRGLRVPLTALTRDKTGRQGVLVIADGRTRFQPVETGGADAQQVLVRKGLSAGDTVAAVAAGLSANQRVRAATAPAR